jgi:hypothetical protein
VGALAEQVAALEADFDATRSERDALRAGIDVVRAERDALQAKLDLLDPDVPYWSDDFTGSWLTRWNVGDRNDLDKAQPTADGEGLHVTCAKGSLGIFGAHASPFEPCEHAIMRWALTMDDDWDWNLTAGKSCGLGGTLYVPNRWSTGAGGHRWEHGPDTNARKILASSTTDPNLKRASGFMVKALFGKYETSHLYIYGPGHVGTRKTDSSYFGQTIAGGPSPKLQGGGVKNHHAIEILMNTPGKADGYIALHREDVVVAKTTAGNLRSELHPDLKITQALLNHQFGGGPADAPTRDTGLTISDVSVERLG